MTDPWVPEMWRGEVPYDQSWGHKTTDIKWKLYYKTKELRDNAGGSTYDKPYIVDMWRDVGLDESNVWRLEVAFHNANRFEFEGERLSYSASRDVDYQNEDLNIGIFYTGSGFTAGTYQVQIYCDGFLIGSTELPMR